MYHLLESVQQAVISPWRRHYCQRQPMAEIAAGMDLPQSQSRLDFTGAAIEQECSTAGKDDAERGEAPDIVLPHQEAEFVRHIAMDIGGSLIKLVYFSPEEDDESSDAIESDASSDHHTPSPGSGRESSQGGSKFSRTLAQFEQSPAVQDLVASAFADTHIRPADPSHSPAHPIDSPAEPLDEQTPGDGPATDALEAARRPSSADNVAPATPPQRPKTCDAQNSRAEHASNHTLPSRLSQQSLGVASEKAARGGRLHFVKFETRNIEDAIRFIEQKQLLRSRSNNGKAVAPVQVRATGGGAFKYTDLFRERLGVVLRKEDEMACLVDGCSFLLKAIRREAFEFNAGEYAFKSAATDLAPLYPYLLVNIGSGVSMIKVDGDGVYERVSGTNLGGGTFWGLCRLLTRARSFDDMLRLSSRGDSSRVDMLVGDIYGGKDYEALGLSAETIASSFGRVVSQDQELEDYNPADIALALCRMVSYNIGHLAFLNAKRYGITRLFFGGFFIRGHPYTMNVISYAIRFWSKGEMRATFLRHEGFLGGMGAFLKGHPLQLPPAAAAGAGGNLRGQFVERFAMGLPFSGGTIQGPPFSNISEKVSWVEKFLQVGTAAAEAAREEHQASALVSEASAGGSLTRALSHTVPDPLAPVAPGSPPVLVSAASSSSRGDSAGFGAAAAAARDAAAHNTGPVDMKIGVLHYSPGLVPFPLLADLMHYNADTYDLRDPEEREFWLSTLAKTVPTVVAKACLAAGERQSVRRRAQAMGKALAAHLERLRSHPEAYGLLGLSEVFEMREDCLREFRFYDIHAKDKQRENAAALQVLGDLFAELDSLAPSARLHALVQGVLAANIFDWGAQACVNLYHEGTILELYQQARRDLAQRPWRVDDYDALEAACLAHEHLGLNEHGRTQSPFRKAMLFVDNAGADAVLGMVPLARELLAMGADVVLVANSYPAINDITSQELAHVVDAFCVPACGIIAAARAAATARCRSAHRAPAAAAAAPGPRLQVCGSGAGGPCLDLRRVSAEVAAASRGVDLVVIEGMGRAVHTNFNARFKCPVLKLAMIKTQRVAERLFNGKLFDCMCRFGRPADVAGES